MCVLKLRWLKLDLMFRLVCLFTSLLLPWDVKGALKGSDPKLVWHFFGDHYLKMQWSIGLIIKSCYQILLTE